MDQKIGKVYLVGAGPGDPELITVKGLRLLESADVVVHDRLVGNEMLNLCHESAQLIDVGKYPDHHRVNQAQINQILVSKAMLGKTVVRLKGGDPFVFGRGMEEMLACRAHGISCHVIPGISSCIAGPASIGIPVTTRGHARSFAVITGQTDPNLPEHDIDFAALAKIDTVVFMMGRKNLPNLASALIRAGRDPETATACIQQATMAGQKAVTGSLANIAHRVDEANLTSPVTTIVGIVASMADPDQIQGLLDSVEVESNIQQEFSGTAA